MQASSTVEINSESSKQSCTQCANSKTIYDSVSHEMICVGCGAVINEEALVLDPDYGKYTVTIDKQGTKTIDSLRTPLAYPDMGLSTSISKSNIDANGGRIDPKQMTTLYRMRREDKFTLNRALQRNLVSAFFHLSRIMNKLNLPDAAYQRSAHNYRKALHLNLAKGRSIKALIVASTYAACKEFNLPKTLQEIAQPIEADPVYGGRCYRLLVRRLNWDSPRIEVDAYVNKFANILGVRGKAFKRALDIMSIMKKNHLFLGKNPRAMAAAALFVACEFEHVNTSQAKIANASDVSIISIRNRVRDIRSMYE